MKRMSKGISVIIAALDEAETVRDCVARALTCADAEVIVVDGGSSDGTVELAAVSGATVFSETACRAVQMNRGAVESNREYLLFLHADTLLPEGYMAHVRDVLRRPGIFMGAFRLGIAGGGTGLRLVEHGANLRSRIFSLPYGDQGFFMTRENFARSGGFARVPVMEDFEFVTRVKKMGGIGLAKARVLTSSRRWRTLGLVRTTIVNQLMITGYLAGTAPERLARLYAAGFLQKYGKSLK